MENNSINLNNPYKQYLDNNFLKNIDEKWKAYFMGWIWSDGHVNHEAVSLTIKEKDRSVLDFFNEKIYNGKRDIRIRKPKGVLKDGSPKIYACFKIFSAEIVSDLRKMGISNTKTFNLPFPSIKEEYFPDFIRGFFDGDGCAFFNGIKNKALTFFCGTFSFLEGLKLKLAEFNIKSKINKKRNIFQLVIYDHLSIKNFYDLLYENECFCLLRKKEKIQSMLQSHRSRCSSKEKYIFFDKNWKKWVFNYKSKSIQAFKTEIEAINFRNSFQTHENKRYSLVSQKFEEIIT